MSSIYQLYTANDIKVPVITYDNCYEFFKHTELFSPRQYNKELDIFKSEFVYNSNLLSGMRVDYYVTKAVLHNDDIPGYIGKFDYLVAIHNFEILFQNMWKDLLNGRQVGLEMIQEYHSILMNGLSKNSEDIGAFRKDNYPCSRICNAVEEKDIIDLLQDSLALSMHKYDDKTDTRISKAFEAAISIERIKPFRDGNGRIARVIMNYFLLASGLPPVIIYNSKSNIYFDLIKNYSKGDKSSGIDFIKDCTILTWESRISGGR